MNILHILPSAYLGGSELCAFETIKVLQEAGNKNFVAVPNDGPLLEKLEPTISGYAIIKNDWWLANGKWSIILKIKMIKGYFNAAFTIRKYMLEQNIDVVITHTIVIPSGALAGAISRKPHIWYIHEYGDLDHNFNFQFGKKNTLALINTLSKKIIVNSIALFNYFKKYLNPLKVSQIYYAVNYPLTEPLHNKATCSLTIVMVGRIAKGKNQLVALQALVLLKKENIYPKIIFVGGYDKDYLIQLTDYIDLNHIGNQVEFVGQTTEPWKYVQEGDCVLVCSKNEAFGRVTVEAMKSGKVAVVSNTGAGPELVNDRVNGFLFNPDNAFELSHILKSLWKLDSTVRYTMPAFTFASQNFTEQRHYESFRALLFFNHSLLKKNS